MSLIHVLAAILALALGSWLLGVLALGLVALARWLAGRVVAACYHGPRTRFDHKGIA